jgi:hypothetical protein
MVYLELFEQLDKENVRYLLCGGLAVSIYGIPRSTADIDLLIDFEKENLEKFSSIMKQLKYTSIVPVELSSLDSEVERKRWKDDKNMIAISFFNQVSGVMHVDVIINLPFKFEEFWAKKNNRDFNGINLNMISIENLIKMKEFSNRIQDKQDIIQLLKLVKK